MMKRGFSFPKRVSRRTFRGARTAPTQREEQFVRLRDRIEQCADRKFQAQEFEGKPPGIILRSIDFRN